MVLKIFLIILYFLVLYNFTFLNIGNIYNFNISSLDFILFVLYFLISVFGLIFLLFYNIKNIAVKNNLKHTFKSIVFLYIFLIIGFFISQEFLIQNRNILTETKLSGNLSFLYLSLGLLVSPILVFIKSAKIKISLILSRKLLGILVFIILLRHLVDFFKSHYPYGEGFLDYWNYFYSILFESPVIWSGTIGAIMIILLGITSNIYSLKKLGGKIWKKLHLLVFPAYLFSMLHVWYLDRIDWFYGGFTVIIILFRTIAFIKKRYIKKKI